MSKKEKCKCGKGNLEFSKSYEENDFEYFIYICNECGSIQKTQKCPNCEHIEQWYE